MKWDLVVAAAMLFAAAILISSVTMAANDATDNACGDCGLEQMVMIARR